MTVVHDPFTVSPARRHAARAATSGLGAGVVLGVVDLLAQRHLPYPWANLANSPAVWGVASFAFVVVAKLGRGASVVGGAVFLLTATVSYYLAAAAVLGDPAGNALSGTAWFWYVGAVDIGILAGTAAWLCRSYVPLQAAVGAAFAPALLAAEASVSLAVLLAPCAAVWVIAACARLGTTRGRRAVAQFVVLTAVLAIVGRAVFAAIGLHGLAT